MNEQNDPKSHSPMSPPPLPGSGPAQSSGSSSPGSSTNAGGASTLLADGCSFEGKAKVSGTLRVEGAANGDIEATDSVVVGKSGNVDANVRTRRAVLNGRFTGKIDAEDCVEMQAGSNVEAEIHARNMVMEDGVQFEGNCKIGK